MRHTSDFVMNSESAQDYNVFIEQGTQSIQPAKIFQRSDTARAVAEFHTVFNLPRQSSPSTDVGDSVVKLRIALLKEECEEFSLAAEAGDLVAIADALADVVYVAYGTAVTYGIDLDLVLSEVHQANMSKLDDSGKPIRRADGKILKSRRYTPPDVKATLAAQRPLTFPELNIDDEPSVNNS